MTLAEIWRTIEGPEFAARLNVASGIRTFLAVAMQQDPTRGLIKLLEKRDNQEKILRRVVELSRQRIDPRYENPWDAALAIYVWVLNVKGSHLGRLAAEAAIEAPHCWWAEKIAQQVASGGRVPSQNYTKAVGSGFQIARNAGSDDTYATLPFFTSLIAESPKVQFPAEVRLTNVGSGEPIFSRRAA